MSLSPVAIDPSIAPLSDSTQSLLALAHQEIDGFMDNGGAMAYPAYVPADFEAAYRVLVSIVENELAPGSSFCEWGSGFGVVAMLGASLGLRSHGIEIERELVGKARELAKKCGVMVEFVEGSFVPTDSEHLVDSHAPDKFSWLKDGGADGHEELGMDVEDFDIIFAYPWPGEESVIDRLFSRTASDGALLVTYHGEEGVKVQRKRSRSRRFHR